MSQGLLGKRKVIHDAARKVTAPLGTVADE
jgi:hypothetical protein